MIGECCVGFGFDVHARTGGYVVKNDRFVYAIRNAGVHMDEPSLGGFVVVGGDDEERIRANLAGTAAKSDGVLGIIAACACDDGNSAANAFYGEFNGGDLFVIRQRGGFARRSADDEGIDARIQLTVDQIGECFVINFAVAKRGDERGCRARENRSFHRISFLANVGNLYME